VVNAGIHEDKLKDLLGENLCLDFVNTVSWRGRDSSQDFFNSYRDLLNWSENVNIITEKDLNNLSKKAERHPLEAKKVLEKAIELREVIYAIFLADIEGISPKKGDLSFFNANLSRAMCHSKILPSGKGFSWKTEGDKETLDWMLNPIVRSAADLLVSSEVRKVKVCVDNECRWLFLDSSRNQSRRWCNMKDCGNRAKARRFYQKKKAPQ
jgi:predicted RNA-binding Zn ribbon-like protein